MKVPQQRFDLEHCAACKKKQKYCSYINIFKAKSFPYSEPGYGELLMAIRTFFSGGWKMFLLSFAIPSIHYKNT